MPCLLAVYLALSFAVWQRCQLSRQAGMGQDLSISAGERVDDLLNVTPLGLMRIDISGRDVHKATQAWHALRQLSDFLCCLP